MSELSEGYPQLLNSFFTYIEEVWKKLMQGFKI